MTRQRHERCLRPRAGVRGFSRLFPIEAPGKRAKRLPLWVARSHSRQAPSLPYNPAHERPDDGLSAHPVDDFPQGRNNLPPAGDRRRASRTNRFIATRWATSRTAPVASPAPCSTSASSPATGWRRSAGTTALTSRPISPSRSFARSSTRSISVCTPRSSPTSSITRKTSFCWLTRPSCRCGKKSGRSSPRSRRSSSSAPRGLCRRGISSTKACWRSHSRPSISRSRRKTTPSRCVTPPAPPARPKACCTRTARWCSIPSGSRSAPGCTSRNATPSSRSCRCSTPTRGDCPSPP